MPREITVFGVMLPSVLPLFLVCLLLQVTLDRALGALGFYRRVWHPSLVRLCLFAAIFGGAILYLY